MRGWRVRQCSSGRTASTTVFERAPGPPTETESEPANHHERSQVAVPIHVPTCFPKILKPLRRKLDKAGGGFLHNHPSGDPPPSRADIDMTRSIIEVARALGIAVHDHIIVGKDGHASLKGLKLI